MTFALVFILCTGSGNRCWPYVARDGLGQTQCLLMGATAAAQVASGRIKKWQCLTPEQLRSALGRDGA